LVDQKQYKKAVKCADALLKKNKEHGETMAMKGLALHHLERRDEAWLVAKLGLKLDVTSYICWHAFALMHRRDDNFVER
jgi:N-alpha-acetyltransferase 15/16, NatA auxiliary subunit